MVVNAFLSTERIERDYDAFANRWKHGGGKNINYIKGRAFEYYGIRLFRKHNFVTLRSFGSLGPFDYLAYRGGVCYLVQAKWSANLRTTPAGHDLVRLVTLADGVGAIAVFQGITDKHQVRWWRWGVVGAPPEITKSEDCSWIEFSPFSEEPL